MSDLVNEVLRERLARIVALLRAKPETDQARIVALRDVIQTDEEHERDKAAAVAAGRPWWENGRAIERALTLKTLRGGHPWVHHPAEWPRGAPDELTLRDATNVIAQHAEALVDETAREIRQVVEALVEVPLQRAVLARRELAEEWRFVCLNLVAEHFVAVGAGEPPKAERHIGLEIYGPLREAHLGEPLSVVGAVACLASLFHSGDLALDVAGVPFPPNASSGLIAEWVYSLAHPTSEAAPGWANEAVKFWTEAMVNDVRAGYLGWGLGRTKGLGWEGSDGRDVGAPVGGIALVYLAREDAKRSSLVPMSRMSASGSARAAVRVITAGAPVHTEDGYPWHDVKASRDGWVEMVWDGRPRAMQLRLTGLSPSEALEPSVIRGILEELKEDGLRDWLVLHSMAAEQGATGGVEWTWAEHRERGGHYARKISKGTLTDTEARTNVVRRLSWMKRAELRWYRQLGAGKLGWVRIGPFGLIDIPAGVDIITDATRALWVAHVSINPAIYEGARRGSKEPHFTLLPEAALELPARPLRLATLLTFDWMYGRGAVERTAATLWDYARIREGDRTQRKRWPDAARTLARDLNTLGERLGINWAREEGGDSPETLYRITPPKEWTDRVLLGVPPEHGRSSAGTPRTGAQLAAKMKRQSVSRRALAQALGLSHVTVSRAVRTGEKALTADLIQRLTAAGW